MKKYLKNPYFLKYFFALFFTVSSLISAFILFDYYREFNTQQTQLKIQLESAVSLESDSIKNFFEIVRNDLLIFSRPRDLQKIFDNETISEDLVNEIKFILTKKKYYDQVRFISKSGVEILRLDYNGGNPKVIPSDKLQDKSARYYFKETIKLNREEVYVSPLDLNMEFGKIEKPLKPTIRFSTPLIGSDGATKGIVIFNFLADHLLKKLDHKPTSPGIITLLNSDGYWLKSSTSDQEWGFMLADRKDFSFKKLFPAAWDKIISSDNGSLHVNDETIFFSTIYPMSGYTDSPQYFWKFIFKINNKVLENFKNNFQQDLLNALSAFILLILSVSFFGASLLSKLQIARDEKESGEKKIRQSEEQLRLLMESAGEGIFGLDSDGIITFINPAACRTLGFTGEEMVNKNIHDLIHYPKTDDPLPRENCQICLTMKDQRPVNILSDTFFKKDGSSFPVEYNSTPIKRHDQLIGSVVVFNDISKRQLLEKENLFMHQHIQQYQKYQSLTSMAAGIAHNFNNILTAVIGNLDIALMKMPEGQDEIKFIKQASNASKKAAKLSTMMLRYVGQGKLDMSVFDLSVLINDMKEMLEALTDPRTQIFFEKIREATIINGDQALIRQVIVNLVTNAAESFDGNGGMIIIKSGIKYYSKEDLKSPHMQTQLPEGDYIFFEVADTGKGMSAEEKSRAFEPFFSTKFTGRGMGLATALGTMRNHRGTIFLDSVLKKGTIVRVIFPVYEIELTKKSLKKRKADKKKMAGTVLLADDEPMIVAVEQNYLEQLGFEVLVATDGIEALNIFKENEDSICLILLDVAMPRMDGISALGKIRESSNIPVIMVTGYSIDKISQKTSQYANLGFIQKPFNADNFSQKIQEILEK